MQPHSPTCGDKSEIPCKAPESHASLARSSSVWSQLSPWLGCSKTMRLQWGWCCSIARVWRYWKRGARLYMKVGNGGSRWPRPNKFKVTANHTPESYTESYPRITPPIQISRPDYGKKSARTEGAEGIVEARVNNNRKKSTRLNLNLKI